MLLSIPRAKFCLGDLLVACIPEVYHYLGLEQVEHDREIILSYVKMIYWCVCWQDYVGNLYIVVCGITVAVGLIVGVACVT